jgi:carbon storage regulator CsrA
MLIITRRPNEVTDFTLEDGRRIEVAVLAVIGNQVRLGITAAKTILIDRHEITVRKFQQEHPAVEVNGNVV